jgi:myosin heavy subunit
MISRGFNMSRSLNPQLFGPTSAPVIKVEGAQQMQLQSKKVRDVEAQVEVLSEKLDRMVQMLDGKIQQLHGHQKALGEQMKQMAEGFSSQQAALISKVNERRGADIKMQELIDRHNQLVNTFEMRVNQLQKVTSEQEMKVMTYQATYDEVLREIRNLKKR